MRFKHTNRPGFWLGFIDFFTAGIFFLLYMPLGGLQDELEEVRKLGTAEEKDARTDELLSSLRERMYFTREINDFYARSEVLHKDFNMRLREAYPNLTENERKLANLLRQGFSSKYIASLMNITPKSAEINRYRLRSKLGLERSDNLIKFIKSI